MYPIFHPEHHGSLTGYIKNIESVLKQITEDYKVVPGHGPLSTKSELEKYHQMILASIASVRAGMKNGESLEEIQKAGLPSEWESFSHGYLSTDKWISLLYNNIKL
jgi:glyoxylase-like metal-dependent hydrolase (beta-lactamase superfamily II)